MVPGQAALTMSLLFSQPRLKALVVPFWGGMEAAVLPEIFACDKVIKWKM